MRAILVLTDFSESGMCAANCALIVANLLSADLLLVNVYSSEETQSADRSVISSIKGMAIGRQKSVDGLNSEVRRLLQRMADDKLSGHQPVIRPVPLGGKADEHVWQLARRKNVIVTVIGCPPKNSFAIAKQALDGIVGHATKPVLLVPHSWNEKSIRRLLFATDLAEEDQRLVEQLLKVFYSTSVRISICHVHRPVFIADFAEEIQVARFMENIKCHHPRVRFYPAAGENVQVALENACRKQHFDVIAMRHQHHHFFHYLFHQNPVAEAIDHGNIPLLLFPDRR